jgi:hypothetical protein
LTVILASNFDIVVRDMAVDSKVLLKINCHLEISESHEEETKKERNGKKDRRH